MISSFLDSSIDEDKGKILYQRDMSILSIQSAIIDIAAKPDFFNIGKKGSHRNNNFRILKEIFLSFLTNGKSNRKKQIVSIASGKCTV